MGELIAFSWDTLNSDLHKPQSLWALLAWTWVWVRFAELSPCPRYQGCSAAAGLGLDKLAFIVARDFLPALLLAASWCSVYSPIWCLLYLEKNQYLQSPTWVFDTTRSLPVLLEGPPLLLFISDLWKISWQCISDVCWKIHVPLMLGILLGRGSSDSTGRIRPLLVMAFTATSGDGAGGWCIGQLE